MKILGHQPSKEAGLHLLLGLPEHILQFIVDAFPF